MGLMLWNKFDYKIKTFLQTHGQLLRNISVLYFVLGNYLSKHGLLWLNRTDFELFYLELNIFTVVLAAVHMLMKQNIWKWKF